MRILTVVVCGLWLLFRAHAAPVETRACEIRLESYWTLQQVRDAINRLGDMGINCVRVETFYHGSTIYNSAVMAKWGLPPVRAGFSPGAGALAAVIQTAHARGLTVYAWTESFYVWNTVFGGLGPILSKYPQWSIRNADGSMLPKSAETSYYFMSPANLEVRRFLQELYAEIANTGVDGMFVDYLRYPRGALGPANALSFDDASKQRALAELGLDITTIPLNLNNADFKRWTLWRQQQTTDTAKEEALAVKAANPNVLFCPSVHPGQSSDWKTHDSLRDWPAWWPEVASFSMQYYTMGNPPSAGDVQSQKNQMDMDLGFADPNAVLWPAFKESDITTVGMPLLAYTRTQPVLGISYWVYSTMTDQDGVALKAGPFAAPSVNAETMPIRSARTLIQGVLPALPSHLQASAQAAIAALSGPMMNVDTARADLAALLQSTDLSAAARRSIDLAHRLLTLAPPTLAAGDADRNGMVTVLDAVRIMRWLSGGPVICRDGADVSPPGGDGSTTTSDAVSALRLAAGL